MRRNTHETFEARFKVNKKTGCWEWTHSLSRKGYASFRMKTEHRHHQKGHTYAYEWRFGPVPEGMLVHHKCRVRRCVNPDHLEAVPNKDNVLEGVGPTAENARKEKCSKGHALKARPHGRNRYCPICTAAGQTTRRKQ